MSLYVSYRKLSSPSVQARLLDIIIDSVKLEMTLPEDKLTKLINALMTVDTREKVTRKDLERPGDSLPTVLK